MSLGRSQKFRLHLWAITETCVGRASRQGKLEQCSHGYGHAPCKLAALHMLTHNTLTHSGSKRSQDTHTRSCCVRVPYQTWERAHVPYQKLVFVYKLQWTFSWTAAHVGLYEATIGGACNKQYVGSYLLARVHSLPSCMAPF